MKKITLRNEFHGTQTEIQVLANGHVSAESIDKAGRKLCGMSGCQCIPVRTNGYSVVDVDGNLYEIE